MAYRKYIYAAVMSEAFRAVLQAPDSSLNNQKAAPLYVAYGRYMRGQHSQPIVRPAVFLPHSYECHSSDLLAYVTAPVSYISHNIT